MYLRSCLEKKHHTHSFTRNFEFPVEIILSDLAENSSIVMQMVTTLGEDRSDSESTIITRIKFITFFLAG